MPWVLLHQNSFDTNTGELNTTSETSPSGGGSSSSNQTAISVTFDNTNTGLAATNVQDAVEEVNGKLGNILEWHLFGTISPKDDKTNYDITIPQCNEIRVVIDFISGVHRGASAIIPYAEITDAEKIHYIGGGSDGGNYSSYINIAVSKTYIRVSSLILNGKSMFSSNPTVNLYYR